MSLSPALTDLLAGLLLGLSAGLSPGPLLTLVLSESLSRGSSAGLRVAAAPLVTDVPIVALCTLVLAQLARVDSLLGAISLVGAAFVLYLAWDAWRARPPEVEAQGADRSLLKGVVANFLSPHPYLFWLTVGSPILVRGWREGMAGPVLFLLGFYGMLVGSKALLALGVGRWRHLLSGRGYGLALKGMGLLLAAFALVLGWEGLRMLAG